MKMIKSLLVVLGFGLFSAITHAQNPETGALMTDPNVGCAYDYGQYGYMSCGGSGGSGGSSAPSKPRVLASRYGAVALDMKTGAFDSSYGETSEAIAKKNALTRCKSKNCKIFGSYKNACAAVSRGSFGKLSTTFIQGDPQKNLAESKAIEKCKSQGGMNCRIIMPAECSLPQ